MKKIMGMILTIVVAIGVCQPLFAKPARVQVRGEQKIKKEKEARMLARNVDLSRIEDPEARLALQAVFESLGLEAKNSSVRSQV